MSPLVTTLSSLRRRAALVAVAQNSVLALALSAWTIPALLLMGRAVLAATIPAIALAAGWCLALRNTPSLRRVAARADSALAVDDVLVTAWQHLDDTDTVSRLVVRDAERRLARIEPGAVYPWTWPRAANRAMALSAAAAVMASLVVASPATIYRSAFRTEQSDAGEEGSPDTAPASARTASNAATRRVTPVPGAPTPNAPRPSTAASQGAGAPPREGAIDTPTAAASRASGNGRAGALAPTSERGRAGGSASGTGQIADAVTAKAGGQGHDATDGRETGSDVEREALRRKFEAASGRAEAAMARDQAPPGLREYVRAYFNAIRPR